jgi:hypothetical protein
MGLAATCLLTFPTLVSAQAPRAGVVTTLQGTATVARATAPQPAPLRFRDDVFLQDHIVTGERSLVRILLGGKAVVTVRERSALTIHETPTTSTIEIGSGKIALAVAKARMKPGESVQIRTPNAMAGVRGTVVIAEVTPDPANGAITTRFTLLTGIVDVARLDAGTGQPTGTPVTLQPLQAITVTGAMPASAVRAISRAEAQSLAADYKVSLPPPPPPANTQVTEQQIEIAVRHSAELTGSQPGAGAAGGRLAVTGDAGESAGVTLGLGAGRTGAAGSTSVGVGGGTAAVGASLAVGSGGVAAGANLAIGGGMIGGGASLAVGGGTIGAGAGLAVGNGITAGAGASLGGGGLTAGTSVGVGGLGLSGGLTGGGGGLTVGTSVGVGGVDLSGGVTVGGSGGGPLGVVVPKLLN